MRRQEEGRRPVYLDDGRGRMGGSSGRRVSDERDMRTGRSIGDSKRERGCALEVRVALPLGAWGAVGGSDISSSIIHWQLSQHLSSTK